MRNNQATRRAAQEKDCKAQKARQEGEAVRQKTVEIYQRKLSELDDRNWEAQAAQTNMVGEREEGRTRAAERGAAVTESGVGSCAPVMELLSQ